ncbi:MAG: NUDIX domain-containing protein [Alphaproteobacteria bacterium]|nr:NUDIX domain-containing protein [Alphaproteobacteria bacterium]
MADDDAQAEVPAAPLAAITREDVELIESKLVYEGYARVRRLLFRHRRFRGDWSSVVSRELFDSGDAVVVLPYDPVRDEVVLIEQIRAAPLARHEQPCLLEAVAGRIGVGEEAEDVARREAQEEAGARLGRLIPIGRHYASPGIFAEYLHFYCAEVASGGLGGVHGLEDEHEDIRVHVIPAEAAFDALTEGRIRSAPTVICLQWLALYRDALREAWSASAVEEG